MRLGQVLCRAGLITDEQLDYALHLQQHTRERLGAVLVSMGACTQEQIDQAWVSVALLPGLEAAIDRACFNIFTREPMRSVTFREARRRSVVVENLLESGVEAETTVTLEALAEITLPGKQPLSLRFAVDVPTGFAELSDEDDELIRSWLGCGAARPDDPHAPSFSTPATESVGAKAA